MLGQWLQTTVTWNSYLKLPLSLNIHYWRPVPGRWASPGHFSSLTSLVSQLLLLGDVETWWKVNTTQQPKRRIYTACKRLLRQPVPLPFSAPLNISPLCLFSTQFNDTTLPPMAVLSKLCHFKLNMNNTYFIVNNCLLIYCIAPLMLIPVPLSSRFVKLDRDINWI